MVGSFWAFCFGQEGADGGGIRWSNCTIVTITLEKVTILIRNVTITFKKVTITAQKVTIT
jgi:hypothetical protein